MINTSTKPILQAKTLSVVTALLLLTVLNGCAFYPQQKSKVTGKTPEERVKNAKELQEKKDPNEVVAKKDAYITQEQATQSLLTEADKNRDAGKLDEAYALYDRVKSIDANNARAIAGKVSIEREKLHQKRLQEASDLYHHNSSEAAMSIVRKILIENPQHAGALSLQHEIRMNKEAPEAEPVKLKPPFNKPVTLEFRDANIKMLFEALSRATGINFVLDKDIRPEQKASVFIQKASIEDAIEMVLASNGLQKKPLTETSALIYPNNPQKQKDYKDLMVRSFYLTNASAKQVAANIKAILKTKDMVIDDRLNMIIMRDTPEVVRLAEKIVAGNDLADPEVVLDIEVLEITRARLQELGIQYPNQISINSRITQNTVTAGTAGFVTSTSALTSSPLTLETLKNLNASRFDVSPNPSVNARKTISDVNLLSNPRIRVRNNEKAKILVGDKVPVITTVATAGVGSSQSVSYLDVGLKLDVEPRITLNDYVNIKVGLEVSSLGKETQLTGQGVVYQIGTRSASTVLRLKDGETQVLAGLISDDERKSAARIPGIGDIPLIGRLFGDQTDQKSKTEIVLAITPHVVGNISTPDAEISEYWSGTENAISDKRSIYLPTPSGSAAPRGQIRQVAPEPMPEPIPEPQPVPDSTQEQLMPVPNDPNPAQQTPNTPSADTLIVPPENP